MRQADDDCRQGCHVVAALNLQAILVTTYRRAGLTGEHLGTLGQAFASVGAELVELDGEDERVTWSSPPRPQVAVARLVHCLKGVSARGLRQRYRVPPTRSSGGRRRRSRSRPVARLEALKAYIR
jgi:putative transposase